MPTANQLCIPSSWTKLSAAHTAASCPMRGGLHVCHQVAYVCECVHAHTHTQMARVVPGGACHSAGPPHTPRRPTRGQNRSKFTIKGIKGIA